MLDIRAHIGKGKFEAMHSADIWLAFWPCLLFDTFDAVSFHRQIAAK